MVVSWEYVAGFFDGEGTAGVYEDRGRNRLVWSLLWTNTHLPTLEAIHDFIGAGKITLRTGRPIGTKPCYQLSITDVANARRVIDELLPRCVTKQDQLQEVRRLIAEKRSFVSIEARGLTPEIARRMYCDEGLSIREMSQRTGMKVGSLHRWMERQGIPIRDRAEANALSYTSGRRPTNVAAAGPEEIRRLYWDEGLSTRAIAKRLHVNPASVSSYMQRHGIPTRTMTEAYALRKRS